MPNYRPMWLGHVRIETGLRWPVELLCLRSAAHQNEALNGRPSAQWAMVVQCFSSYKLVLASAVLRIGGDELRSTAY